MRRYDVIQEVCVAKRRNIGRSNIDIIVEVEKFNPYHDELGRFTTAGGATLFTIRTKDPRKQHWADMAIAREKDQADGKNKQQGKNKQHRTKESNRESSETVKLTRGRRMSINKACKGANPNYLQGEKYQNNCQRCVQAYEMRRRGYDVTASAKPTKNNKIIWGSECFVKDRKDAYSAFTMKVSEKAVRQELENAPNGARYIIYVAWRKSRSAHVFVGEKIDGKVRYVDPQSGKEDAESHFSLGKRNKFGFFRVDDKELTNNMDTITSTVEVKKND